MNGVNRFVVLGLFVGGIALAAALKFLPADGAPQGQSSVLAPVKSSAVGEFRGITLQLQSGYEGHPFEQYIDEIAQTGANTISFVVAAHQENASSTSIFIDLRKAPGDSRLVNLIRHAHSRSLRVVLMPVVLLENPRQGEWRGKISPANWDDWWEDYSSFVVRYAKIAQQSDVEVFLVGSELVSTEKFTKRWRGLISTVRSLYDGRLGYSANWDHYLPIEWWDALDIVGMTTYYDLTGGKKPTVEQLMAAWAPIKKDILAWQAKINRPILFTEVGWPNQETCAQYPWDYYRSADSPDTQAQANCFEAFFRTWIDEPTVAGFLVWEWRSYPGQKTGPEDTSYVPTGKPAMKVIEKYYRAPASPRPTTQTAPAAAGK